LLSDSAATTRIVVQNGDVTDFRAEAQKNEGRSQPPFVVELWQD
jgi:hypothetical protein